MQFRARPRANHATGLLLLPQDVQAERQPVRQTGGAVPHPNRKNALPAHLPHLPHHLGTVRTALPPGLHR